MKKLLAVTLFAAMLLSGQTPKVEPGLLLTEVETLQISIVLKDRLIVNLQIQSLLARRNTLQTNFDAIVNRLRAVHKAPADKFTFDSATLRFIPLPIKEPPK